MGRWHVDRWNRLRTLATLVLAVALGLSLVAGCAGGSSPSPTAISAPTIPAKPTAAPAVSPPATPTTPPAAPTATVAAAPTSTATPAVTVYIVQPGDTLNKIAEKFGVSLDALIKANNISKPDSLDVGQEIKIPKP